MSVSVGDVLVLVPQVPRMCCFLFLFLFFLGLCLPLMFFNVYFYFAVGLISVIGRALSFCVRALCSSFIHAFSTSSNSSVASVLIYLFLVPPV